MPTGDLERWRRSGWAHYLGPCFNVPANMFTWINLGRKGYDWLCSIILAWQCICPVEEAMAVKLVFECFLSDHLINYSCEVCNIKISVETAEMWRIGKRHWAIRGGGWCSMSIGYKRLVEVDMLKQRVAIRWVELPFQRRAPYGELSSKPSLLYSASPQGFVLLKTPAQVSERQMC